MKEWIGLVARLVTGGVWIVAGALKLPDLDASVRAVRAYDLLPETVVPTIGTLLPIVEVVLGAMLVLGVLTRFSGVFSALLFVAFVIGIASAWARGLQIDCGCFGGGGEVDGEVGIGTYGVDLARDAGLLLLSGWLLAHPRTRWSLDSRIFHSLPPTDETPHEEDAHGPEEEAVEPRAEAGRAGQA